MSNEGRFIPVVMPDASSQPGEPTTTSPPPTSGYFRPEGGLTHGPGRSGGTSYPRCWLTIAPRQGLFYWNIHLPGGVTTQRWPREFSYCVFYTDVYKTISDYTGESLDGVEIPEGTLVWELPLTREELDQKKIFVWEKLISEQYYNGFFFARAKVKSVNGEYRYGPPSAMVSVPVYDFAVPDKIRGFDIQEDPTYVEGSAQAYSNLTISYTPPAKTENFWGVALYIEGYQDNDQPRLVQMRQYNPEFNGYGDDIFQCILEPWAPTVLGNSYSGKIDLSAHTVPTTSVETGFGNDYITWAAHGLYTGQPIVYYNAGSTSINTSSGALVNGATYYVRYRDANSIRLSATLENARNNVVLDLTGNGNSNQFFSYATYKINNYSLESATRFLRKDFLNTTQRGVFYTVPGNYTVGSDWVTYSPPPDGYMFSGNAASGTLELDNPVRTGDTLLCSGNSAVAIGTTYCDNNPSISGANVDNVEAIILHSGDETNADIQGKITTVLKSATVSDATVYDVLCYGNWKIVRSCKFYLVSVNKAGWHGPLLEHALSQYCALDALDSAPPVVLNPCARQYATKNSITWQYNGTLVEDINRFNVYRMINGTSTRLITSVLASDNAIDNLYAYRSRSYTYDDAELYNPEKTDHYATIDSSIKYYVSAVDKNNNESAMRQCQHYDINGNAVANFGHRRHAGVDTGAMVVNRNSALNLLWNSELNWDSTNTNLVTTGMGQCPAFEWALGNRQSVAGTIGPSNFYFYPPAGAYNLSLSWDGNGGYKYFYITGSAAALRDWFMRITRATTVSGGSLINDYPAFPPGYMSRQYAALSWHYSNTTFTGAISGNTLICNGLGRSKICIPAMGYIGTIQMVDLFSFGGNYYLAMAVPNNEPPLTAGAITTIINSGNVPTNYYLSLPMEDQFYGGVYAPPDSIDYADIQLYHRNGWSFNRDPGSGASYIPQTWNNGRLDIMGGSTVYVSQDFDLSLLRYNNYYTFSCQLARTLGASTTGTFEVYLQFRPTTMQPYEYNGGSILHGDSVNLSEVTGTYQQIFSYYYLDDPFASFPVGDTAAYRMARMIIAFSDVPSGTNYSIMQPMLNLGPEGAPYTSMITQPLSWRLGSSTTPASDPTAPSQYDHMCIAFGQEAMLGNGKSMLVEDITVGQILKGWFTQADIAFNVHVRGVEHSKGNTRIIKLKGGRQMEVTDTHVCVVKDGLKPASDVIPGDVMYVKSNERMNVPVKVVSNLPTNDIKNIVKLECSIPNTFYLNGILTHNMKKGDNGL